MEKFKHSGKISLGLSEITHPQGCSGWAKSRSSYLETPNNPAYIFFILGNEQGAIQIIQPTSCFFSGLELGPPFNQSLSWTHRGSVPPIQSDSFPRFSKAGVHPSMSPFLLLLHMPEYRSTSSCPSRLLLYMSKLSVTSSGFYCACAWQRNFSSSSLQ